MVMSDVRSGPIAARSCCFVRPEAGAFEVLLDEDQDLGARERTAGGVAAGRRRRVWGRSEGMENRWLGDGGRLDGLFGTWGGGRGTVGSVAREVAGAWADGRRGHDGVGRPAVDDRGPRRARGRQRGHFGGDAGATWSKPSAGASCPIGQSDAGQRR